MAERIIAIEGIDGSGKTVQASMLESAYRALGYSVRLLSFPVYDSFFGRQIGKYLVSSDGVSAADVDAKSMALWFALDRHAAFGDIDFSSADVFIINRYVLSNAVYQSIRERDLGKPDMLDFVMELEHAQLGLPKPDAYIYLDVYAKSAKENMLKRGHRDYAGDERDVYEAQAGIQQRARAKYLQYARQCDNILVVDCMDGERLLPEQAIAERVRQALQSAGLL